MTSPAPAEAVADTHAVIWYLYDDPRLSPAARTTFDRVAANGSSVIVTTMAIVEMVVLVERGRIPAPALERLVSTLRVGQPVLAVYPLSADVALAVADIDRTQIADLPDRIIAATALHWGVPVITRDERIRASSVPTIW